MARFYDENINADLTKYKSKSSLKYLIEIIESLNKFDDDNDYASYSNYLDGLEAELKSLLLENKIDEDLFNILMKKYGGGFKVEILKFDNIREDRTRRYGGMAGQKLGIILNKDGKLLNPLKYIESLENDDLNQAILRIVPKIDFNNIKNIFKDIPQEENNIPVMSNIKKTFYLKVMEYRYKNVLIPTYNKIIDRKPPTIDNQEDEEEDVL